MLFDFLNDINDKDYCKQCENLFVFCSIAEEKVYDEPSASMSNGRQAAEIMLRFYSMKKGEKGRLDKISDFKRYSDLQEAITREWQSKYDSLSKEQSNNRENYTPISKEEIKSEAERFVEIIIARVKDNGNTATHDKPYKKYYLGSLKIDGKSPRTEALNSLRDLYYIISLSLKDLDLIESIIPYQEPEWNFIKKELTRKKESKIVKIFLASSMDELTVEKLEFERFIRILDRTFFKLGYRLDLISRENMSKNINQEDIFEKITDCQYFFVLIGSDADKKTIEEFDTAINSRKNKGIPKVFTYIHKTKKRTPSAESFIKHIGDDLGYSYSYFNSIDTVELDCLMELCSEYVTGENVSFEDGNAIFHGEKVLSLSNIPIYGNNVSITELKEKKEKLDSKFAKICADYANSPENTDIYEDLVRISEERAKVLGQFRNLENDVFKLYKELSVYKNGEMALTWYEKEAKKQVEEGNYAAAITILRDKERKKELENAILLAEAGLEQIESHIRENELLIKTLKSQKRTEETVKEIETCYQESVELTQKYHLNNNIILDYANFLVCIDANYLKVINITQRMINQLQNDNYEKIADIYKVIGEAYLVQGHKLKEGKKYFQMAFDNYTKTADSYRKYLSIVFCFSRLFIVGRIEDNYEELHIITNRVMQLLQVKKTYINDHSLEEAYGICSDFFIRVGKYQSLSKAQQYAEAQLELAIQDGSIETKSIGYGRLANIYMVKKDYEKALEMRLIQYSELKKRYERNDYNLDKLSIVAEKVADVLSDLGRYKEAVTYLEEAEGYNRILTARNPLAYERGLTSSLHKLGTEYEELYDYYNAEKSYREAYLRRKAALNRDDVYEEDIIYSCRALAGVLAELDKFDEAEKLYREALELSIQLVQKDSSKKEEFIRSSQRQLARNCLISLKKFDEAEGIILDLIQWDKNISKEMKSNLVWDYDNYSYLLVSMKRFEEAVESKKESLRLYGVPEDEDKKLETSIHAHNMAWALIEAGQNEEAFPFLEKERLIREELVKNGQEGMEVRIASTYKLLGDYYSAIGNNCEAEIYYKKGKTIYENLSETCEEAFAHNLAEINLSYSKLMIKAKNRKEAEKLCRVSINLYTELEKKAPIVYGDDLTDAYETYVTIRNI